MYFRHNTERVGVDLENDWEESEKIGLKELKRLGRGAREDGSGVEAWTRLTPSPHYLARQRARL